MKLAFSTLGCPEWSIERIVEAAVRHGFSGVELRGTPGEHVDPSLSPADRREIRTRFEDAGIEPFSVTAYTEFSATDPGEIMKNREELKRYLELAVDLGARYVRSFIGELPPTESWMNRVDSAAAALHDVVATAAPSDTTVVLETHDDWSSVAAVLAVVERVGNPGVQVLWDIAHSLRAGDTPLVAVAQLRPHLAYVHLKDEAGPAASDDASESGHESGEVPVVPGTGIIPVDGIRAALASIAYNGYLCFEWERKWHPDLPPLEEVLPGFRTWVRS